MKKHIVIDARLYGPKHTGLGRYTKNLLLHLPPKYRYTLLIYPELAKQIKTDLGSKFNYVITNIRHYSPSEQIRLPLLLHSLKPDLVHFTHFSKPLLYWGKSVVTVHDLIRHFSKGQQTTTRSPLLYWPKYLGYLLQSRLIFRRDHIIVPSAYWQNYLINQYHLPKNRITVTHEAVDPEFINHHSPITVHQSQNYLVYTGNLYPHKNLQVILQALKQLPDLKLKIICGRSVFDQKVTSPQVEFLGFVSDSDFAKIYHQALALIHPALIEGFSLTGLEAMALSCPVIASNATCIPEIYGPAALYFDPHQPQQLVDQIIRLRQSSKLRQQLIKLGHQQVKKYSWTNTALQTLKVYDQLLT